MVPGTVGKGSSKPFPWSDLIWCPTTAVGLYTPIAAGGLCAATFLPAAEVLLHSSGTLHYDTALYGLRKHLLAHHQQRVHGCYHLAENSYVAAVH